MKAYDHGYNDGYNGNYDHSEDYQRNDYERMAYANGRREGELKKRGEQDG